MTKPANYLRVSGIVRDGVPLWYILRAFEDARAFEVDVRSVVEPPEDKAPVPLIAKPQPQQPPKGANVTRVLEAMKPGEETHNVMLIGRTGLTRKQVHMALYNLERAGKVKRLHIGTYVLVVS
jgi:predicted Rossmann fold nucleotide-binding protein DprA/Smf involved in DNA uptake